MVENPAEMSTVLPDGRDTATPPSRSIADTCSSDESPPEGAAVQLPDRYADLHLLGSGSFGEFVQDTGTEAPYKLANNGLLRERIEELLKTLTFREREIIRHLDRAGG